MLSFDFLLPLNNCNNATYVYMKKSIVICLVFLGLVACKHNDSFKIGGSVQGADGKILYLEHAGLFATNILDSVKLQADGTFDFKQKRPSYPDFYNLRIDDKSIILAVDSCEEINIDAKYDGFANDYSITGSLPSSDIQKLRKSVVRIQQKANSVTIDLSSQERNNLIAEIERDIENHKVFARTLILKNPLSTAAYFALYQKVNNTYLFSPYNKTDDPYCKSVATAYNAFMPDYERSKNLYALVMDAIRSERSETANQAWHKVLKESGIGYINIELKDQKGNIRKLSESEGKVVLIDFSTYSDVQSGNYIFSLRDVYTKYHKKGFEIYQISLDANKEAWKKASVAIPWISVRDEDGPNTKFAVDYNISSIPTSFLMNRKGEIIARNITFAELPSAIEKCL